MARQQDNRIILYKGKTQYVNFYVIDASGSVGDIIDGYDYWLYAKKYPLTSSANVDVSVGPLFSEKYPGEGRIKFPIYPYKTNELDAGDYLYQVIAYDTLKSEQFVIAEDTFKLLDSLVVDFDRIVAGVDPSLYNFTVHDRQYTQELFLSSGTTWTITKPSWLDLSPDAGSVSTDISVGINTDPIVDQSDDIQIDIASYGAINIPVTFTIRPLSTDSSVYTFDTLNVSTYLDVSTASDNNWTVSGIPSWITLDTSEGSGPESILLTASLDPASIYESFNIDSSYYYTITVDASFNILLTVSPDELVYTGDYDNGPTYLDASSYDVSMNTITLNEWEVTSSPSWLTIEPSSGAGIANINVKVSTSIYQTADIADTITFSNTYLADFTIDVSYIGIDLDPSLFWTFDNTVTSAAGGYTFTEINSPGYIAGKVNQAISCPTDIARLSNSTYPWSQLVSKGQDFSISSWVKAERGTSGSIKLFRITDPDGYPAFIDIGLSGVPTTNLLGCTYYGDGDNITMTNWELADWNHIVVTFNDADKKVYYYINNSYQGSTDVNASISGTPETLFLHFGSGGGDVAAFDQLRIFSRTLNEYDVSILWNNGDGI